MKAVKLENYSVVGKKVKIGDQIGDLILVNDDLEKVKLSSFKQDYIVFNVIPSIDTGVCDYQTRQVNEELAAFENVLVITVSTDLPFAQSRWCGANGLPNILTLSDYLYLDFAKQFGVLIPEYRLLLRSMFILNNKREVVYAQYLEDVHNHPDYEALMKFAKKHFKTV